MLRLGLDDLGLMDKSLSHFDLPIYRLSISFYRNIWRISLWDSTWLRWGFRLLAFPKVLRVCVKYVASLNVYSNRLTGAVKNVSLIVDTILNSSCKYYTCLRRFQLKLFLSFRMLFPLFVPHRITCVHTFIKWLLQCPVPTLKVCPRFPVHPVYVCVRACQCIFIHACIYITNCIDH